MTASTNLDLVVSIYADWERGDFSTREPFDDRLEFVRIGPTMIGIAGCWTGIDELRAATLEWIQAWDDHRIRAERFIEIGNRVLVLSRVTARGKRSEMPLDHATADIFTLRDCKIVRLEMYWDRHEGMRAARFEG